MRDVTFDAPDLTAFCRLDDLGLVAVGQRVDDDRATLACRVVGGEGDRWCRGCGSEGTPRDSATRRLAHAPFGWRPTTLAVTVARFSCSPCGRVWRQDMTAAAGPRAKISRSGLPTIAGLLCRIAGCVTVADRRSAIRGDPRDVERAAGHLACQHLCMRISTNLDYAGDFHASAARAVELEQAGVDAIWVAEAYGFDAISMLGYLAAKTDRVTLGTGIINVYSRTPALIAQTAAGLDRLTEGRFELGLGASGPQVIEGWHGMPYTQPIIRLRETIDICRIAWARERLVYDGKVFHLPLPAEQGTGLGKPIKMINTPQRRHIPIHIASLGMKSVELCAASADGWLPFLFVPERASLVWGDALARGLAKREADLGPLEVTAGGLLAIGPMSDVAPLRELVRPMLALYIGGMGAKGKNFYNDVCRAYGWEREAELIQDLYLAGKKDEAAAAVPAELVEKTTLCGDAAYLRDRVAAYRDAGVTSLNVAPVGADPVGAIAALRDLIG